jgi:hypothetical protein
VIRGRSDALSAGWRPSAARCSEAARARERSRRLPRWPPLRWPHPQTLLGATDLHQQTTWPPDDAPGRVGATRTAPGAGARPAHSDAPPQGFGDGSQAAPSGPGLGEEGGCAARPAAPPRKRPILGTSVGELSPHSPPPPDAFVVFGDSRAEGRTRGLAREVGPEQRRTRGPRTLVRAEVGGRIGLPATRRWRAPAAPPLKSGPVRPPLASELARCPGPRATERGSAARACPPAGAFGSPRRACGRAPRSEA